MKKQLIELLNKFAQEPEKCSLIELYEIKNYYGELRVLLNVFKSVHNYDPNELVVKSFINNVEYYIDQKLK